MSKQWKWKCFEARYNPTFWVLPVAIGLDFAKCPDRGIGIGVGPFSFSLVFP